MACDIPSAAAPTPRKRLRGRSARVQRAVLAAAMDVLTESGMAGLSIAAVGARAGVHPTSIYRRWRTRESLVLAACLDSSAEALPIPDRGTLGDDLTAFCRALRAWLTSPRGRALLALAQTTDGEGEELRRRFWKSRLAVAATMFERAAARGEIAAAGDANLLVESLIGPLYLRLLVTGEPLTDDFIDHHVTLMCRALGARPPTGNR